MTYFIVLFHLLIFKNLNPLGIIPSSRIATVTREGKFAASMIDGQTELIFMDEWTSDSLSCEDAKRILQGSYCLVVDLILN